MRVLFKCATHIDILFSMSELENVYATSSGAMVDPMELSDVAYKNGVDIGRDNQYAVLIAVFEDAVIARVVYADHDNLDMVDCLGKSFTKATEEYYEMYTKGLLLAQAEKTKKFSSRYIMITVDKMEHLKEIIDELHRNVHSALYKYKGRYHLVMEKGNKALFEHRIREFADMKVLTKNQLILFEDRADCIAQENAIDVIENYY